MSNKRVKNKLHKKEMTNKVSRIIPQGQKEFLWNILQSLKIINQKVKKDFEEEKENVNG